MNRDLTTAHPTIQMKLHATSKVLLLAALLLTAFGADAQGPYFRSPISADSVGESALAAIDSANDEECLTFEATGGDFEWQVCGAGGSGTDLAGFITDYSGNADGSTDDSSVWGALNTAAASAPVTVVLNGVSSIDSTVTLHQDITIVFVDDGALSPTTGNTVTVDSRIQAGPFQIFTGDGTIAFDTSSKQRDLRPEWWGCFPDGGTTDCTAGLNAVFDAADDMQGARVHFGAGNYEFNSGAVNVHRNTHLIGIDRTFSSVIRPDGAFSLEFVGDDTAGGFSFRNTVENLMIDLRETDATDGVIFDDAYNTVVRNVYFYECATTVNSENCVHVTDSLDMAFENVIVYAADNSSPHECMIIDGSSHVSLLNNDYEQCNVGIVVGGSSTVDVIGAHIERNIYGMQANTTGAVNVFGGRWGNPNSGAIIMQLAGSGEYTIVNPDITRAGGEGIYTANTAYMPNVTVIGVDPSDITQPDQLFTSLNKTGITGYWTNTFYNKKTLTDEAAATTFYTLDPAASNPGRFIVCTLTTIAEGSGRGFEKNVRTQRFYVSNPSGTAQVSTIVDLHTEIDESSSGNFGIDLTIAATPSSGDVLITIAANSTGVVGNGTNVDVYTILEVAAGQLASPVTIN